MKRREFITVVGGAAVGWPRAGRAQQPAAVVGFLRNTSSTQSGHLVAAFRSGLGETGFIEGRNLQIEYRWTDGQTDQLPAMAADLVARRVGVIVALGNTPAARAAKAATTTIPVVFMVGTDPVEIGLVASLNRPGGNITGIVNLNQQLAQKWLEVLHELVPAASTFALFVNPRNPGTNAPYSREVQQAARALGLQIHVLQVGSDQEFSPAFARARELQAGGVVIAPDLLFISRIEQLAALTLQHAVPALYPYREFVMAGGLVSYGTNLADTYRLAGIYAGRVLKGEKPADLPVQQATKVELLLNLKTAKALGLTVPPTLLARADEVIE